MLKAIIVDCNEVSAQRMKNKLASNGEIEVCDIFMNLQTANAYVNKSGQVQLAFLNLTAPDINGMGISQLLHEHHAAINVMFVTTYDNYAAQAYDIDAANYLMKSILEQQMIRASDKRSNQQAEECRIQYETLTQKEVEVVQCMTTGLSNKEIAEELYVSVETVKSHLKNVYRKLDVNNRIQVLQRANQLKILRI